MQLTENEKRDAIRLIYIDPPFDVGVDIIGNDTMKIIEVRV